MDKADTSGAPQHSVEEARRALGELIRRVSEGEDIAITMRGTPAAIIQRLVPRTLPRGGIAYVTTDEAAQFDADEVTMHPDRWEAVTGYPGHDIDALLDAIDTMHPDHKAELEKAGQRREQEQCPPLKGLP